MRADSIHQGWCSSIYPPFDPTDIYPGSHEGSLLRENQDTLEITGIAVSDVNVVILLVDPRSTTQSLERKKTL